MSSASEDDVHARHLRHLRDVELGLRGVLPRRRRVEVVLAVARHADQAANRRHERLRPPSCWSWSASARRGSSRSSPPARRVPWPWDRPRRRRALYRFSGPSALTAVDGRIEPTMTTGLSVFTVRFRKNADSSRVSVPWVITKPSTSRSFASSLMRLATVSRICEAHVLRADVRDLLALDGGEVRNAGHGGEHRVDGHGAGLVTGLRARGSGAGNRASSGQDHHVRLLGLCVGQVRADGQRHERHHYRGRAGCLHRRSP